MKKMKRLFAVMMAILVIAGSLPVYSFAAQTEGEQPAQETVSEYAENGVSAAFTVHWMPMAAALKMNRMIFCRSFLRQQRSSARWSLPGRLWLYFL